MANILCNISCGWTTTDNTVASIIKILTYMWMNWCVCCCMWCDERINERWRWASTSGVYSTKSHHFSTNLGSFTVKGFKGLGVRWDKTIHNWSSSHERGEVGGARMRLLGIGGAAEHLADPLDDGVPVDAVDLQQLMRFATARNVRHGQAVHSEARLVDHARGHRLAEATWRQCINIACISVLNPWRTSHTF